MSSDRSSVGKDRHVLSGVLICTISLYALWQPNTSACGLAPGSDDRFSVRWPSEADADADADASNAGELESRERAPAVRKARRRIW